jgi:IMP dehydrogenase
MENKVALTFDDILLTPQYSKILPGEVDTKTRLTRNITLNIPIVSAAMDTVTESLTAIRMASLGGIGIIHKNLTIEKQAQEASSVKKYESFMIKNPVRANPDQKIHEVLKIMKENNISGVPIINEQNKLVGILTNRDLRFETNLNEKVGNIMTKENLITVGEDVTREKAKNLLHKYKIEKLLVIDKDYKLKGLITIKDIKKAEEFPNACKDVTGRLRVGASVGVSKQELDRIDALIKAEVDVLVVDTAHGHSKNVLDMVSYIKSKYKDVELIAGNVATSEGTMDLIEEGVDAVKVGMGPGSICTTRIISGVGVPQITAILDCVSVAKSKNIPIISDGGIKFSGDIVKAIACGADSVMIGSLFAGTDESPGELELYQGRSYKIYRGMGSEEAMRKGSRDRYMQFTQDESKLVPEGIEGRVPYRGPLSSIVQQLIGGLKSGMGYTGCKNIIELKTKTKFIQITDSSLRESHVHDVIITKEASNYRVT